MKNLYQYRKEYQMILEDMALSMFRKNLLSFKKSGILDKKVDPEELKFTKSHLPNINDAIKSVQSSDKLQKLIGSGDDYLNDKKQYKPESLYKVIKFYKKSQELSNIKKDDSNTNFASYNIPNTDIVVFIPFNAEANRYLAHSILTKPGQPVPTWCIAASGGRRYWNFYKLSRQEYPPVFIFCRKSGIGDKYDGNKYEVVFTHLSTKKFIESDKDSRFAYKYDIEWRNPEQDESAHFFGYSNNFKNTFPEIAGPEINLLFRKLMQKYKPDWDKIRKKQNKKSFRIFSSGNLSVMAEGKFIPNEVFYIKQIKGKISPLNVIKIISDLNKYNFILDESAWETIYNRLSFDEFIHLVKWVISNRTAAELNLEQFLDFFSRFSGKYELRNYFLTHEKFNKLLLKAVVQFCPHWSDIQNMDALKHLAANKIITPAAAAERWVGIRRRPHAFGYVNSIGTYLINDLINLYYTDNNPSTKKFAENCLLKIQEINAPVSGSWVVDTFTELEIKPTDKFGKMVIKSIIKYASDNLFRLAGIIGPGYGSPIFWRRYDNLESWRKNAIDTVFYNYIKKHLDIFNNWRQEFGHASYYDDDPIDFEKVLKEHSPKLYKLYEIFLNKYGGRIEEPVEKPVEKTIKTTPLTIIKKEIKNDKLTISSLKQVTDIDNKATLKIFNFLLTAPINYDKQPIDIKQMYGWVLLAVSKMIQKKLLSGREFEKILSLIYNFFDNNYQDLKWIPFDEDLRNQFGPLLITHVLFQFIKQQKIDINFIDILLLAIRHGNFHWDLYTLLTEVSGLSALLYKKYNISDLPPNEANMIKQDALS